MEQNIQYTKDNFHQFCEQYYNEIFHYVRKQVDDIETAKDLTQDIFLRAHQKMNTYQKNKSSMRTWIYKIAYHQTMNYFKSYYYKNKLSFQPEYFQNLESNEDILEYAMKQESVKEVLLVMKKVLNKKHLKIMNYYFFSDLSNSQISEELHIPVKTIRNVIAISIKKIQLEMKESKNDL